MGVIEGHSVPGSGEHHEEQSEKWRSSDSGEMPTGEVRGRSGAFGTCLYLRVTSMCRSCSR
jgi:hypothetical protein